jgi:hypothetical protein
MSGTIPAGSFTDQQKVDIRRFCGYLAYGTGAVVFPYPWIMRNYMALEYRMDNLSVDEVNTVVTTYLTPLYELEQALVTISNTLNVDTAAVFKRNANEQPERVRLFNYWRTRLCNFMGVPPGDDFAGAPPRLVV